MAELKVVIRQRGSLKARLTNFKNYLGQLGETPSRLRLTELETRLEKIESIESEFHTVQGRIESLVEEDDLGGQYTERDAFESLFFSIIAEAKSILESHTVVRNEVVDDDNVSGISHHSDINSHVSHSTNRLKLPTINLSPFSGSYDQWLEFREMFESLIHKRTDIQNIEKFHYLRSTLAGDAAQVIRAVEFTSNNYNQAWKLLCDRYNNDQILINNHVKALFNLETIKDESAVKIRALVDNMSKHLQSLKTLQQPIEFWDILLIHIVSTKLDPITAREWEEFKFKNELPTFNNLKEFLNSRALILETLTSRQTLKRNTPTSRTFLSNNTKHCVICKKEHNIFNCDKLSSLPPKERVALVKSHKVCVNCLKPGHFSTVCKAGPCRKCGCKLLHIPKATEASEKSENTPSQSESLQGSQEVTLFTNHSVSQHSYSLLSTVQVQVKGKDGRLVECRALLDNGSQSNLISNKLCDQLGLQKSNFKISLSGIGSSMIQVKHQASVKIMSRLSEYKLHLTCLVVPKIGGNIPTFSFDKSLLKIPYSVPLADPNFNIEGEVDILIGSSNFWSIMAIGQISLGDNMPVLQKTLLGWVVSGPLPLPIKGLQCNLANLELSSQLQRFWEVEEVNPNSKCLSNEERDCERLFTNSTTRLSDGRFVVRLPIKGDECRESRENAVKRLYGIEKRLKNNPELSDQYKQFMAEYEGLNHMTKISYSPQINRYFIPHHPVVKNDSITTKVRVIFDASCKSSTGHSLNDILAVGPTIQQDLFSIVLRFRKHNVGLTADIEKMYRQVKVAPDQRHFQSILWRHQPTEPVQEYELCTVTYGAASAAYLAIRCLHQTAYDSREQFPEAADIILADFYVDDLLTGANSTDEAIVLKSQITSILAHGCFPLRKWISNQPSIFKDSASSNFEVLKIGKNESTKTLGLLWNPNTDVFQFSISLNNFDRFIKRTILSTIAQIFDPMGLVAPVIITAKVILQKLCQCKVSWDDSLPQHIYTEWANFHEELLHLNRISVIRKILIQNAVRVELHGFADARNISYGACIYVRSLDKDNDVQVTLLCAKSKVAPLKPLTTPRLELCGALVLARLMEAAVSALNMHIDEVTYWTDSSIVLGQLKKSPSLFQTFVCHRLSEIQRLTQSRVWRHVQTDHSPADILSRGLKPKQIVNCDFWFKGPVWLSDTVSYNSPFCTSENLPEMRKNVQVFKATYSSTFLEVINKFSDFGKIKRITAYCLRFISRKSDGGPLKLKELNDALLFLIRISQMMSFPSEYDSLSHGKVVHSKSRLLKLSPFMDPDKILRVDGRLMNSPFDFCKRHPIILDSKHRLTILIFEEEHKRLLHPGPQLLLASLRDRYWPISGRNLAKKITHACITCFRANPKSVQPIMASLPASRVTPNFPFSVSGVDYAGPLQIKDRRGRGAKTSKCYLCLFVCFCTKSVHLELVTALSTEAFILALRRFTSRRGRPSDIYSHNGTNFVGAHSELNDLGKFLTSNQDSLNTAFNEENINWHFIPAHSPHFGGLWEAGIKSAKSHLKRVTYSQSFTYEELSTLLAQIEAILNSRPLSPISSDPRDYSPLTPSHFLIGRPATSIPDLDLPTDVSQNRLKVFQRIEYIKQSFWKRWASEYVGELQQRMKWQRHVQNIEDGTLVVIKGRNLPPLKWSLGRIVQCHPGNDNVTRVVTIKTERGLLKRSVSNICPLPLGNSTSDI